MPDGTSVGGSPSVLFQTLNAKFATASWQLQFQKAAAVWQAYTNVNLSQVSDNGSPEATNGNQQGDSRFGDIRIGMVNLGGGAVAVTLLPPPFNGGTNAGDMLLNSAATWRINTDYDLETVAIHEFGHALGLGESDVPQASMYGYYNGMKQSLNSDDVAGIQSVWGAPQPDLFNVAGQNNANYTRPANITSIIDTNNQITIPSLRINTGGQVEWFSVTVPSTTSGTMVVNMQSSGLSMLSPKLSVYTAALGLLGSVSSNAYGDTVTVSIGGVKPGQSFLIRASGNSLGSTTGGFGLEVNFGSVYQAPISPPNTVVPAQPDQGGGIDNLHTMTISLGSLSATGTLYEVNPPPGQGKGSGPTNSSPSGGPTAFGSSSSVAVASTQSQVSAAPSDGSSDPARPSDGLMGSSTPDSSSSTYQAIDAVLPSLQPTNRLALFTKGNTPVRLLPE
jgi:hypothetical protein